MLTIVGQPKIQAACSSRKFWDALGTWHVCHTRLKLSQDVPLKRCYGYLGMHFPFSVIQPRLYFYALFSYATDKWRAARWREKLYLAIRVRAAPLLRVTKHPLLRTILQRRRSYHIPFLLVCAGEVNRKLPWEDVHTFNFLTARFSLAYPFSLLAKATVNTLIDNLSPVPVYSQPYLRDHDSSVLGCVKCMRVPPNERTLFI